jgi:hypothetical protein
MARAWIVRQGVDGRISSISAVARKLNCVLAGLPA